MPVLGQLERNDRLEIECRLGVVIWPEAEPETQHRGQLDHVRERVELLLGEGRLLRGGLLRARRHHGDRREPETDESDAGDSPAHTGYPLDGLETRCPCTEYLSAVLIAAANVPKTTAASS